MKGKGPAIVMIFVLEQVVPGYGYKKSRLFRIDGDWLYPRYALCNLFCCGKLLFGIVHNLVLHGLDNHYRTSFSTAFAERRDSSGQHDAGQ